jgi:photosystem II stability/assembly factor-like uncharacterized protein
VSNNQVFLTCYDDGISRAEADAAGNWSIEHIEKKLQVTRLAADPINPGVIYAGTRGNGVWRSKDKGKTWHHRGLDGQIIMSVAVSPHPVNNAGIDQAPVYAGTKPAHLFSSLDGGSTWEELEGFRRIPNRWWWFSPAEPPDRRAYVNAIAPSPTQPNVVLAGVEFGAVVRSDDGGKTWSRHLRGSRRDCHTLMFHDSNGDWVYEAGGGGASFSRDGGVTWQKANRGLAKHYGIVCAADCDKPEIWYVCVAPSPYNAYGLNAKIYFYRSLAGAGWQPIGWSEHPLTVPPKALVTLPGVPGSLFAGLSNGDVWHSENYGDSWEKLPFNLGGVWSSMLVLDA